MIESFITKPRFDREAKYASKNIYIVQQWKQKLVAQHKKANINTKELEQILNKVLLANKDSAKELNNYLEQRINITENSNLMLHWDKKLRVDTEDGAIGKAYGLYKQAKREYDNLNIQNIYDLERLQEKDYNMNTLKAEWIKKRQNQAKLLGDAFENYLFMVLMGLGDEQLDNLMDKSTEDLINIIKKNPNIYDETKIAKSIVGGKHQKYSYNSFGDPYKTKIVSSSGKVDVSLDWAGQNLAISAKNIGSSNPISLVGSTTILNALGAWGNQSAVNAYLNYTRFYEDTMEGNAIFALQALAGRYREKKANVFIVNNRSNKKTPIQVVQMYDIINYLDSVKDGWGPKNINGLPHIHSLLKDLYKESGKLPENINNALKAKMSLSLRYGVIRDSKRHAKTN